MASPSKQPITLQDVAALAGVSVSTASRALNGNGRAYRISQATVDHVKAQAARVGFQPSRLAKSLRTRKSGLIGVIVPDVSNPFFASIAREVTLQAEGDGFAVLLADSRNTTSLEVKLLEELRSRQVEGLIVCPVGAESKHLEHANESGTPLVIVDRCFPGTRLISVSSDNIRGTKQGMKELLNHGHTVIGCLQGVSGTLPNEQRLQTIQQCISTAGLKWDDRLVAGTSFTEESGYEAFKTIVALRPDVTAMFAFSIPNAMGAMRAAADLGLQIPRDISLVTFDDLPFAEFMKTPLSTVSQNVSQLGHRAAEVLCEQLKTGKRPRKKAHSIPVEFVSRESVAMVRQTTQSKGTK